MEDLLSICKECLQELVEIRHHMRAVDSHMLALDKLAELVVALPKTGSSSSGRSLPSSPTEAQPKSLPDSQEAQEAQESSRAEEASRVEASSVQASRSDPFEELLDPSHGPAVIRHNRTFAVPRVPDGGAGWLPPNRPLLASYNYHDMVCETIYMKGSKDMQRAQQYMDSKQQREEERMAWSSDRFRRQRATTKLFADMQETFGEILGKPAAPPWPKEE
ncbi:unnamed protein product, partial [Polarella glacialis]